MKWRIVYQELSNLSLPNIQSVILNLFQDPIELLEILKQVQDDALNMAPEDHNTMHHFMVNTTLGLMDSPDFKQE